MGQPYRAGNDTPTRSGCGSIEIAPHNTVHSWTGDPKQPFIENMGTFYTAARDPIFHAHHANIDRLWNIWVNNLGGKLFSDPNWLDSSFVFYNKEAKPVTVKVNDCLDSTRFAYVYKDIDIPRLDAKPTPRRRGVLVVAISQATQVFPTALDRVLDIIVTRPKKLSSKEEKDEAEEVLLIDGIEYDCSK
ncbi:Aureusidin synthase [Sesamum alatum]|uniref:Aureusidin synthase n=1 Tax=Sesamum alatum TaxID=300844 RepID=A0AAE2CT48_9LAMI|nr:Aureusidin synthase [Sesamum alatum]